MKQYICIDIGGTEIKHGMLDENEKFLAKGKVPTEAFKGGPALLKRSWELQRTTWKERKAEGICVSTGMVDVGKGEIFYAAPLIPEYAEQRSRPAWRPEFGLPCEVENDVNCAGLAEAVSGAAAGGPVGPVPYGRNRNRRLHHHRRPGCTTGGAEAPARWDTCTWTEVISRPWELPAYW